jgi:drug/metabolite transporter (DMT)-like permease
LGVIFLILQGDLNKLFSFEFNEGDIWIIISSLLWALYSVVVKFKPKDINDIEFFSTIVSLGFILLLPVYLYQGYSLKDEIQIVKDNYLIFGYVSIFASSLSYYFWHHGINNIGAAKTAQFTHLMPIFGAILAYIFLDEVLQFYHIVGIALIAFGIYLSLFYKTKNIKD